jgi:hypothetical protein
MSFRATTAAAGGASSQATAVHPVDASDAATSTVGLILGVFRIPILDQEAEAGRPFAMVGRFGVSPMCSCARAPIRRASRTVGAFMSSRLRS